MDDSEIGRIFAAARATTPPDDEIRKLIDELGERRFGQLTWDFEDRTMADEKKFFVTKNTQLGKSQKKIDLKKFTPWELKTDQTKADGTKFNYQTYNSTKKFKFLQLQWIREPDPSHPGKYLTTTSHGKKRQLGHFEATPMEDYITIGVDRYTTGPNAGKEEVSHLVPKEDNPVRARQKVNVGGGIVAYGSELNTLSGTQPYNYKLTPTGGKGKGKGKGGTGI